MNDNAFNALANEDRRRLLVALLEENPQPDTGVVSVDGGSGSATTTQQLDVQMYHSHLPKLEDYGYIEWNKDANEVVKGPRFDELRPLLECARDHTDE